MVKKHPFFHQMVKPTRPPLSVVSSWLFTFFFAFLYLVLFDLARFLFQMAIAAAVAEAVRRGRNLMKVADRLQMRATAAIHQIQIWKKKKFNQSSTRRLALKKHLTSRNRRVQMKDPFFV
jgi:apolipoprotein N-acyltransferase